MPSTKRRLKVAGAHLSARLARVSYPEPVREIAGSILSGIGAAQINVRVHPAIKAKLVEDVAKLEAIIKAR